MTNGPGEATLSDEQIAAMTLEQRRALMRRLERRPAVPPRLVGHIDTVRRVRLGILTLCVITLVPWTIYLGFALPQHYEVHNWRLAWVGFDVILLLTMAATAWLAWRRRQLVILGSFASGILLTVDAWFDVSTSAPGDRLWAVASALVLELPLAFLLVYGARRLLVLLGQQRLLLDPGQRLRHVTLRLPDDDAPC